MLEATQILADVSLAVSFRNAEVLQEAFVKASITCPNCLYPEYVSRFAMFLNEHRRNKIELHRAIKSRENHFCIRLCQTCASHNKRVKELSRRVKLSRQNLKEYWPCEDCIVRYNPTDRKVHPAPSLPEPKGFLNV